VETFAFDVIRDPQADDRINDLEQDQRHDGVVNEHNHDAFELVENLARIAFDQAGGSAVFADREHAGKQRADNAADRVDAEAIQRVVNTEHALEARDAP